MAIRMLIGNELTYYEELDHRKSIIKNVHKLAEAAKNRQCVEIAYQKEYENELAVYHIKPLGVVFSESYFYVIAESKTLERKYPTAYRVDQINRMEIRERLGRPSAPERIAESAFQQRVHFMHTGEITRIKLHFTGPSLQAVLDRLPTARVLCQLEEGGVELEAEVYLRGIEMWLLSQGEHIEVLEPPLLRESMKRRIEKLQKRYK